MKKKFYLLSALVLALVVSGGLYAYTFTTAAETIAIASPIGDFTTVNASATQPNWNSVLPYTATEILRPIAAGDETLITGQFPITGAHWDKVDEATSDGDTTYVFTTNWDWQNDLYHIADTSVGSGDINYVKVYWVGKIENAGSTNARARIETGGTAYNGPDEALTTSYASYSYQWNINPQTATAWTWSDVDALQVGIGLRRPNPNRYTRVTQVYAEVSYSVIRGAVPTGDLFNISRQTNYTGDLSVKVYLVNTGALVKAYRYLNMQLYLTGSEEAGQTPNYRLLTLENGVVGFTIPAGGGSDNFTLSVTGGSYYLVSANTGSWSPGWTVTPQFVTEVTQR